MPKNLTLPIVDVEGIGPAIAGRLQAVGVTHIGDLLWVRPAVVHGAADDLCSPAQVERWRRMAILMQVDAITPQWAEALVRQGVESLEAVYLQSAGDLADLFAAAVEQNVIPAAPDAATLGEIKTQAAVLHWSGAIQGRVVDAQDRPVAGVRVVLGGQSTTTDARGRYRLAFINAPGAQSPLWLKKKGFCTEKVNPAPVVWDDLLHRVERHVLAPAPAGTEALERFSEFDGDDMPALGACGVRVVEVDATRVRDGDLFKVTDLYTRWPQAKLLSRFRDFEDGEMVAYKVRYPMAQMPAGVGIGDFVIFYRGRMHRCPPMGPGQHSLLTSVRRFRRQNPGVPQTAEEFRQRMAALIQFVYQSRKP